MARFRFKIVDSQGRRRSGVLRAESREAAETGLLSKLCEILELAPLEDHAQSPEIDIPETSFSHWDRLYASLVGALALVVLVSVYKWVSGSTVTGTETFVSSLPLTFQVRGTIHANNVSMDPTTESAKVRLVFPEIAFQAEGSLAQDGQSFELPIDLQGVTRPTEVFVELRVNGRGWRSPVAARVPSSGDAVLGDISLEPILEEPLSPALYREALVSQSRSKIPAPKAEPRERMSRQDFRDLVKAQRNAAANGAGR